MIDLDITQQDEFNQCLTDAITVAELLVDGSHESDPIAPRTIQHAGDMIADSVKRARDIIEEGREDVVASLVDKLG